MPCCAWKTAVQPRFKLAQIIVIHRHGNRTENSSNCKGWVARRRQRKRVKKFKIVEIRGSMHICPTNSSNKYTLSIDTYTCKWSICPELELSLLLLQSSLLPQHLSVQSVGTISIGHSKKKKKEEWRATMALQVMRATIDLFRYGRSRYRSSRIKNNNCYHNSR